MHAQNVACEAPLPFQFNLSTLVLQMKKLGGGTGLLEHEKAPPLVGSYASTVYSVSTTNFQHMHVLASSHGLPTIQHLIASSMLIQRLGRFYHMWWCQMDSGQALKSHSWVQLTTTFSLSFSSTAGEPSEWVWITSRWYQHIPLTNSKLCLKLLGNWKTQKCGNGNGNGNRNGSQYISQAPWESSIVTKL